MITVAMPMYNAKAIGWLALESLYCDAELHDLLPAEVADRLKAMIP